MILDPVTRRYADALFELAREKGRLEAVQADVERIARELSAPGFADAVFDARVEQGERKRRIGPLLAALSPLGRSFVELLFAKRRELVLRDLGKAFHRRSLAEAGAVEGVVESPRPLAAADLERLAAALGKRLSKTVRLENRVSSGLVAGVRVIVQNRMIDYSARGRLDELRRRLMEAPLPSAS